MKPKIIFFGSDKYSVTALDQLGGDKRFKITSIVTHISPSPVEEYTKTLSEIKFTTVKKFDQQFIKKMEGLQPDVGVLASFGKILPKEILEIPQCGILNIHPSLLPKYRGASPVQMTILDGEQETGVTIIKMDEKMDHGPIAAQFKEEVRLDDTAESLYQRLFAAGAEVLKTILPAYLEGQVELREQDHAQATYAKKLTREDGKVDWKKPADYLERFIRAMHPWPGAFTNVKLKMKDEKSIKRLKILRAHLEGSKFILDQVQLEGKRPVSWKQFQEGYPEVKFLSST